MDVMETLAVVEEVQAVVLVVVEHAVVREHCIAVPGTGKEDQRSEDQKTTLQDFGGRRRLRGPLDYY